MPAITPLDEQYMYQFDGKSFTNFSTNTVIYSQSVYPSLTSVLTDVLSSPLDMFTVYTKVNAAVECLPVEIGVATIHVRLLSLKAWMDGKVTSQVKNAGDTPLSNALNDKITYIETISSAKKTLLKDAQSKIGLLAKNAVSKFDVAWKVDGLFNIYKALVDQITKGKMQVTYTCHVAADYTIPGKVFGLFPTTKDAKLDKNYSVAAAVAVRKFVVDITL